MPERAFGQQVQSRVWGAARLVIVTLLLVAPVALDVLRAPDAVAFPVSPGQPRIVAAGLSTLNDINAVGATDVIFDTVGAFALT